ncbi:MAG: UPF0280 family protein [Desulfobacterota bacterium]|nr:UPF0280 family protein [Thermodesulfobacteriota bacterium]
MTYAQRFYRTQLSTSGLTSFLVTVQETDLFISADANYTAKAYDAVLQARMYIEQEIHDNPLFETSLCPLPIPDHVPPIIREMLIAGAACSVGPMAAVAGAIAEYVGRALLAVSREVIVENGGDIFVSVKRKITAAVFAGTSPLSHRIGITIPPETTPLGICTSSGTVGPSFSFGKADAVTVVADSAALADAAATALGNRVVSRDDIAQTLVVARSIPGVRGVLIIVGDALGAWGDIHLVEI